MCKKQKQIIREIQRNCLLLAGDLDDAQLAELNKVEQIIYKLQKEFEKGDDNGG